MTLAHCTETGLLDNFHLSSSAQILDTSSVIDNYSWIITFPSRVLNLLNPLQFCADDSKLAKSSLAEKCLYNRFLKITFSKFYCNVRNALCCRNMNIYFKVNILT